MEGLALAAGEFAGGDDVDCEKMLEQGDAGLAGDGLDEGGLDGLAGHILHVQDTPLAVAALAAEIVAAVVVAGEL